MFLLFLFTNNFEFLLNLISFNSLNSLSRSAISSLSLEFYKYPLNVEKNISKKCKSHTTLIKTWSRVMSFLVGGLALSEAAQ